MTEEPQFDFQDVQDGLVEILPLAEAAERMEQDTSALVSSGFGDLDGCMKGGFREGDFNVITGIPGEGRRPWRACLPSNSRRIISRLSGSRTK